MRLPDRSVQVFSLSALDVLAMATGVFVLLLVLLMPYYRKTFDAQAAVEAARVSTAATTARIEAVDAEMEALRGETERLEAATDAAEAEAERLSADAAALALRTPAASPPLAEETAPVPVTPALDLVFVVDTTASMRPVLEELAFAMRAIVRILDRLVPSVRVGIAAYSDEDTGLPPLDLFPLTDVEGAGLARVIDFVFGLSGSTIGSMSIDEDLHLGLNAAVSMRFRPEARQALVVMTDAPAHDWALDQVVNQARNFTFADPERRSVSTLFIWTPNAYENDAGARDLLREIAAAGRGTYNEHSSGLVESVLLSVLTD